MPDLTAFVPPLLQLCLEAGQLICDHYHAPGDSGLRAKTDNSPLTHADMDSHAYLRDGLAALTPQLPLLSEESSPAQKAQRHAWPRFWMVDPLDGTKEFIAGTGEFTINIALIDQHRPVLGVLYIPLQKMACVGVPGELSARFIADANGQWRQEPLHTRALPGAQAGVTVLASRRHRNAALDACLAWLEAHCGPLQRENSGSALKFCQLAEGRGDVYPRFSPCSEWDVAAGQAVVEAAGGSVLGLDGNPLRYNCRDSLLSPHFLAVGDAHNALWPALLAHQRQLGGDVST